ncbi:MAG: enoyl-CoA hydratase/isomerase family protein, partial [Thermoleophilia bacterium]
ELEDFTDRFARRIASFDKVAVCGIKKLVDVASLPQDAEFAPGLAAFFASSGRPENASFVGALFEQGFQQPDGAELELGAAIGRLRQEAA